ncbi:hypothetical protein D3C85_537620 [compost metagenome]
MFDLSTLKTLSAIRPIATLGASPQKTVNFDKFYLERMENFGSQKTGIILSVNTTPHVIEQFDIQPRGSVMVQGKFNKADRDALLVAGRKKSANRVIALTDSVCAMRFQYARLFGQVHTIEALQKFFNHLRRAYHIALEGNGQGVMKFSVALGSVNVVYTSVEQIEATLYPMAYHFFKDDTEL